MLNSKSALTSVERNPLLKLMLRETFYKQFCGGENKAQVHQCKKQLQEIGYQGMILEYALEVLADAKDSDTVKDVAIWRKGLLDSVDIANPGDFVGLKYVHPATPARPLANNLLLPDGQEWAPMHSSFSSRMRRQHL